MFDGAHVRWVDNTARQRYELYVGDERVGLTTYALDAGEITYFHTEVDEQYEGKGLAGWLVAAVLDDARHRGLVVRPRCPYIRGYILRHPEYADLVAADFDMHPD